MALAYVYTETHSYICMYVRIFIYTFVYVYTNTQRIIHVLLTYLNQNTQDSTLLLNAGYESYKHAKENPTYLK